MKGKRLRTEYLEVRVLASPLPHPRVGFVVPKHKQSAVSRNRLKRRLREIVRTRLLRQLPPVDLVVRSKPSAYDVSYEVLERDLLRLEDPVARVAKS
jgi:ribonuclease P protein component